MIIEQFDNEEIDTRLDFQDDQITEIPQELDKFLK